MFSKIKRRQIVAVPREVLLRNRIEKDLQRYVQPLNILQNWWLYPKYQLWDNFVTPNGWKMNVLQIIVTFSYVALFMARFLHVENRLNYIVFTRRSLAILSSITRNIGLFLSATGHVINCIANVSHAFRNVSLIITVQETLRRLNYPNMLKEIKFNWIYSIVVFADHMIFYIAVHLDYFTKFKVLHFIADLTMITFDINMLYAMRIIILLKQNLYIWIKDIKNTKKNGRKEDLKYWKNMFEVFSLIIQSYRLYIKVFQELILYFILDFFVHTLAYIQIWLTYTQSDNTNKDPNFQVFLRKSFWYVMTWVIYRIILTVVLGKVIEEFYVAIEETQTMSSILLTAPHCEESEKRTYKNVCRLYRSCFTKVNLRGLFDVEATLPLQLASVTTTYVLAILQYNLAHISSLKSHNFT